MRYNTRTLTQKRNTMSKHHLVVFANYCRDTGMTLVEAVKYVGDNYDNLTEELVTAYDDTYMELMQFCNTQIEQ
jgi:hypothetical protein